MLGFALQAFDRRSFVDSAPQSPQNLAKGGLKLPQEGHGAGEGAPHSTQKRLPSGTAAPQLGHFMLHHPSLFRSAPP